MSDQNHHEILDKTRDFILNTPGLAYPAALAVKHPYILDKIAELHRSKDELRDYFDSLINNDRIERKGFEFEVLIEIQTLREFLLGDVNGFQLDDVTKWVS